MRVLKKDGSPSKVYVRTNKMRHEWVVEGAPLSAADVSWKEEVRS